MELFEKSKSESIKLDVLLIKQLYSLSVLNASPHSREAFIEIEESFKYATYCWHVNLFMKAICIINSNTYQTNSFMIPLSKHSLEEVRGKTKQIDVQWSMDILKISTLFDVFPFLIIFSFISYIEFRYSSQFVTVINDKKNRLLDCEFTRLLLHFCTTSA